MRLARLSEMSDRPVAFQEKLFKFSFEKIWQLKKSPYLCSRNRNDSDKFFERFTYQQVVQETYIKIRNIPSRTTIKRRDSERRYIKNKSTTKSLILAQDER